MAPMLSETTHSCIRATLCHAWLAVLHVSIGFALDGCLKLRQQTSSEAS